MGAKASTEFGQIYINTDKPGYFQGEYISGMISLNLIKDFPGNEILFKIKGKEEARWAEGVGRNKIQHQGKKIILSHQFLLYRFNSLSIPKGQYRFPFSLFMAPSLPASFRNMWPTAIVSYKIKGEIKSKDKNFKVFRNSQVLRLKQAKNDAYAPLITNLKVAVDIFCCFDQGNTKIETKVNKTNFFEGETALIECSVDNSQCNLRLTTVEMSLVRKLTMKSDWDDSHTISFTYSSKINRFCFLLFSLFFIIKYIGWICQQKLPLLQKLTSSC